MLFLVKMPGWGPWPGVASIGSRLTIERGGLHDVEIQLYCPLANISPGIFSAVIFAGAGGLRAGGSSLDRGNAGTGVSCDSRATDCYGSSATQYSDQRAGYRDGSRAHGAGGGSLNNT